MTPERFVVVDGLDGSGKDTQALLIAKKYINQGQKVCIRSHPSTDNHFGRTTRRNLESSGKKARIAATIFFILDVIRSLCLSYGGDYGTLIFVRYLMGTAYLPDSLSAAVYRMFSRILPDTDYKFCIDVSATIAYSRVRNRGEKREMFESFEKLQKKRFSILSLAKMNNWFIIDGNSSIKKTWQKVEKKLDQLDEKGILRGR